MEGIHIVEIQFPNVWRPLISDALFSADDIQRTCHSAISPAIVNLDQDLIFLAETDRFLRDRIIPLFEITVREFIQLGFSDQSSVECGGILYGMRKILVEL